MSYIKYPQWSCRRKKIPVFINTSSTRSSNMFKYLSPVINTLNLIQSLDKLQGKYKGQKIRVYSRHSHLGCVGLVPTVRCHKQQSVFSVRWFSKWISSSWQLIPKLTYKRLLLANMVSFLTRAVPNTNSIMLSQHFLLDMLYLRRRVILEREKKKIQTPNQPTKQ